MRAYLDHAAATPLDPRIVVVAQRFLGEEFGSPDGLHDAARRPSEALRRSREQIAGMIGAEPEEIILTSSGTESLNLGVKGLFAANRGLGGRIVATSVEHPATLAAARTATRAGGELTTVAVDGEARLRAEHLAAAVEEDTALVVVAHGQADVGTLQDLPALVGAVRGRRPDARILIDATATAGLVPIDVEALGADALAVAGPSLGAPGWSGALWVRAGARLHPLIEGGVQEGGKRAGEPSLPGAVALGAAAALAEAEMGARRRRLVPLTERLVDGVLSVPDVRLNGPRSGRIPGNVHVSVAGVEGESLALALATRGVAVSPGSACTAHAGKASPVLEAMGLEAPWTLSAILMTASWTTAAPEIDHAIAAFADSVATLRALSPVAR